MDYSLQFGAGFRLLQTRPNVIKLTSQLLFSGSTLEFGEAQLTREDNTITAVFYEAGIVLSLSTNLLSDYFVANCYPSVPISFSATTKGLWGNFDGGSSNDLYRRGETTPLPNNLNGVQLYSHLLTCKYNSYQLGTYTHYTVHCISDMIPAQTCYTYISTIVYYLYNYLLHTIIYMQGELLLKKAYLATRYSN